MCVEMYVYLFRTILNTIGIVKYLEGGVFIYTIAVVVKNNDAKINTHNACVLFKRLRIRHEMDRMHEVNTLLKVIAFILTTFAIR